jgi:hypothetical protein
VTGAWQHEGGGAHYSNHQMFPLNRPAEGLDVIDPAIRILWKSRIARSVSGDRRDLGDGPPVTALLIQTNPLVVSPDPAARRIPPRRSVCLRPRAFMTEAAMAISAAATTFEHDDIFTAGGRHFSVDRPRGAAYAECRSKPMCRAWPLPMASIPVSR